MPELSIIIPLLNEDKNLMLLYERLNEVLSKIQFTCEIIFVNDGSCDNTQVLLEELAKKSNDVKIISLTRNFGHQAALMAGLDGAKGDAVITLDGDLQDPPELIPELISKWKEGHPVVYARRENYRNDNFLKRWFSMLFYYLLDLFKVASGPKNVGDFRLIDKEVHLKLISMRERTRYLRGMISWLGYQHAFVDYKRPDRTDGKAGYSFKQLIQLAMDGFFSFSRLPLRIGFFLGILSIFIGLGFMVYMIADILINNVYYHLYKLLVDVIFIFIGFIFILIWILGEYIGRIYHEVKGREIYIVDKKINFT
jgi:glycosyltransferase involved in cell wall biosynthesis